MVPIEGLFEAHLTVSNLERSMRFYGDLLGMELASVFRERGVAFYWLGGRGKSMLGLWEAGTMPQRMSLHVAFSVQPEDVHKAMDRLRGANITALNFSRKPASEPEVLCWMPAVAIYFEDPDGNLLEFLGMLEETPRPELGVVRWSEWERRNKAPVGESAKNRTK